jgi:hypothetical protein
MEWLGAARAMPPPDAATAPRLRDLRCAAAARHARMLPSPKLQCESRRPALGSSRPRLRIPASAGHSSQCSTGRDSCAGVLFACRLRCSCEGCDRSCVVRVKVAVWGLCGGLGAVVDAPLGRASTDPGLARPEDPVRGDLWTVIDGVDRGDSDRRRLLQRARAEDEWSTWTWSRA